MHERIRRLICRTLFVCVCLVPTLFVLSWISWHHLPSHRAAHARELSRQFGLSVALGGVAYPQPGVIVYRDLTLAEPELGQRLAVLPSLTMTHYGDAVELVAAQATLEGIRIDRLWQLLARQVRLPTEKKIHLVAAQAAYRAADGTQQSIDAEVRIEPTQSGMMATVACRAAAAQTARPTIVQVVRNLQTTPPTTRWTLDARDTTLPASFISGVFPHPQPRSNQEPYRGLVWGVESPALVPSVQQIPPIQEARQPRDQ